MQTQPQVRLIKRYANRKLYDVENSQYLTLQEVGNLIQAGNEVLVTEHKTNKDITHVTLAKILFDKELIVSNNTNTELLVQILRTGNGTLKGYLDEIRK